MNCFILVNDKYAGRKIAESQSSILDRGLLLLILLDRWSLFFLADVFERVFERHGYGVLVAYLSLLDEVVICRAGNHCLEIATLLS